MPTALLLAALLAAPPEGVGRPYELSWSAPEECPRIDSLTTQIDVLLGPDAAPPADGPVRATAKVRRGQGGYTLELLLDTSAAPRELEAPSCSELSEAAALIVAIAVNPDLVVEDASPPEPEPEPEPASEPTPEATPEPPTPDPTEPGPSPHLRTGSADAAARDPGGLPVGLHVRADAGLVWNVLPGAAGQVGLALGVHQHFWRAEARVSYGLPRVVEPRGTPAVGGRFQLLAGHLRGCGVPDVGPLEFPLCAGVQAGGMLGVGRGTIEPVSASAPWAAVEVGPGIAWIPRRTRGRLALIGGVDVLIPITRPAFDTEASGIVHRAGSAGLTGQLGIEFRSR